MANMIAFCDAVLHLAADFLASEPIIYLFGLILLCFIAKTVKVLLP